MFTRYRIHGVEQQAQPDVQPQQDTPPCAYPNAIGSYRCVAPKAMFTCADNDECKGQSNGGNQI